MDDLSYILSQENNNQFLLHPVRQIFLGYEKGSNIVRK